MALLEQLQKNKGCVSSALSKSLAKKFFLGDTKILDEAFKVLTLNDKNVRVGAIVIIEEITNEKPELVLKHLSELLKCLEVDEPQTRWISLRILGKCASLSPEVAKKGMVKVNDFLKDESLCLQDSAITYLGYIGALSTKDAKIVFPILEKALVSVPKRITRVFESFQRITPMLDAEKKKLTELCEKYVKNKTPSISSAAKKTLKALKL